MPMPMSMPPAPAPPAPLGGGPASPLPLPPPAPPPDNPFGNIEKGNRVVSLLFLVLLLLFFMDYQARRHYDSSRTGGESVGGAFDQDLEIAREELERAMQESKGGQGGNAFPIDRNRGSQEASLQPQRAKAGTILGAWNEVKTKISAAAKKQKASEILEAQSKAMKANAILSSSPQKGKNIKSPPSPPDEIVHRLPYYWLYFIRFSGKKSKIVRVKRFHKPGPLRLSQVLRNLREGPNIREKGLLNNFDKRMKIHHVSRNGSRALLDLDSGLGRMGPHVIHDRLEQIAHTLTQFPQIRYVGITVDGKVPNSIGDSGVLLPRDLGPQTPSYPFTKK